MYAHACSYMCTVPAVHSVWFAIINVHAWLEHHMHGPINAACMHCTDYRVAISGCKYSSVKVAAWLV